MAWRPWHLAVILVLASVPLAIHATGAAPCVASPTRVMQDDADTGADAPDTRATAVTPPIPPPDANGDLYAYYWGWLDPPTVPGADTDDWYQVALDGNNQTVMLSLVSNYSAMATVDYGDFQLDVYGPGDITPIAHTTSADQNGLAFDDARAGTYAFHVYLAGGSGACGPATTSLGDPARAVRNHGVYFGCHPFCVDTHVHAE